MLDNYRPISIIFLDLQKAFDTINHVLLLGKLESCGTRDDALNLLASCLADRKQTCQVNDKQSGLRSISCGIPQDSTLGRLSFSVYINDLPNSTVSNTPHPEYLLMIPAYQPMGKLFNKSNYDLMKTWKKIRLWLQVNKLSLNVAKTEYMLIGSSQTLAKIPLIRSKESEIPKFLECILMNLLRGASILKK